MNRTRSNNANPFNFCAAFSSKVRVVELPLQIPSEPISASSKVQVPFRRATTAAVLPQYRSTKKRCARTRNTGVKPNTPSRKRQAAGYIGWNCYSVGGRDMR